MSSRNILLNRSRQIITEQIAYLFKRKFSFLSYMKKGKYSEFRFISRKDKTEF